MNSVIAKHRRNKMKKILTVLGARPEFIQASVVSHAIAAKDGLTEIVVHAGQHFDTNMSDVFFDELGMRKSDYFLDIHGGTHGAMTGRMLAEVEQVHAGWMQLVAPQNLTNGLGV
jgi:UDP-GlcNAc3NAcA epimerase